MLLLLPYATTFYDCPRRERERRSDALQRFEKERRGEDDDDPLSELRRRGTSGWDRNRVARPYFTEGVSLCSFDPPTCPEEEEEEFLVNLRV